MDTQYEDLLKDVLINGTNKEDRTGTGTRSVFGRQLRYDLEAGFPLITTKKVFTKGIIAELLWFLSGSTNIKPLQEQGVHIWDAWADENGDLGPVYGSQWRNWEAIDPNDNNHAPRTIRIDQIQNVLDTLRNNPDSRRIIVSAWNPGEVDSMALPPCHALFQFYVANGKLSLQLYQRSADLFLGVPFNIASYALLTHMVAQQVGLAAGEFIWTGGDCHIYNNHIPQVLEQVSRKPHAFPFLGLDPAPSLFEYTPDNFHIFNYKHHPAIKGEVAV